MPTGQWVPARDRTVQVVIRRVVRDGRDVEAGKLRDQERTVWKGRDK